MHLLRFVLYSVSSEQQRSRSWTNVVHWFVSSADSGSPVWELSGWEAALPPAETWSARSAPERMAEHESPAVQEAPLSQWWNPRRPASCRGTGQASVWVSKVVGHTSHWREWWGALLFARGPSWDLYAELVTAATNCGHFVTRDPRRDDIAAQVDGVLDVHAWCRRWSARYNVHLWLAEAGAWAAQMAVSGWKSIPDHLLHADREATWQKRARHMVCLSFIIHSHVVLKGLNVYSKQSHKTLKCVIKKNVSSPKELIFFSE